MTVELDGIELSLIMMLVASYVNNDPQYGEDSKIDEGILRLSVKITEELRKVNQLLYEALIEAGASSEKARLASRAVAEFDKAISDIRSTLKLHGWMLSFNTAMLIALLLKVFSK